MKQKRRYLSWMVYLLTSIVMIVGIKVALTFSSAVEVIPSIKAAGPVYTNEQLTAMITTLRNDQKNFLNKVYPVGSIYITVDLTNPGKLVGGTWVAYGNGRTLAGVDTTQGEFNTPEKTGGALTVKHAHGSGASQNGSLAAAVGSTGSDMYSIGFKAANYFGGFGAATYTVQSASVSNGGSFNHFTQVWGNTADKEASIVQPYITVYMWKRIS
ncbi:MAG: hypothetical protein HFG15_02775 [Bacilli bacterium]|nr:hypothetical protein [Bacilli bacterium]